MNGDLTKVLKDVGHFVSIFGETRKEFDKQLKDLEIRLPRNINEAYLYYKYIVRKSEADFLSDFQYFQKPISRDQWTGDDSVFLEEDEEEERKRKKEEEEARRRKKEEEEKKKDEDEGDEQEDSVAECKDLSESPSR